ncbi:MAG: LOG family protein [Planctomycetaceae bacterium]|nr:LOG family protein [Planctomycetaceae bacterium]
MSHDQETARNIERILQSPSYRLAYKDIDFLSDPRLRPARMELELLKPEMAFEEQNVASTIVVFGGTRIVERAAAEKRLEEAKARLAGKPNDPQRRRDVARAERLLAKSHFYDVAREFGRLVSTTCQKDGKCDYVIVTGGGPGIMEAGNRGAYDVGAKSIGLNIKLPMEQRPNPYITPELCFQFHYFAIRKLHFLLRAKGLVVFPGGFGTLDELFDTLTLRQTGRMQDVPVIMFGREFWQNVINFQHLADEGTIDDRDLNLISFAETAQEAWDIITAFHAK